MRGAAWLAAGLTAGVLFTIVAPSGCNVGGVNGDCTGAEGELPREGAYSAKSSCAPGFVCSTSEVVRVSDSGGSLVYSYLRQGSTVRIEYRHLRGVVTDLGGGDR